MKLMKRATALFLCFLMLTCVPISAFATESVSGNDVATDTSKTTETKEACQECSGTDTHTELCPFNVNMINLLADQPSNDQPKNTEQTLTGDDQTTNKPVVNDCPNCDDEACTGCNGSQQEVVPPASNEQTLTGDDQTTNNPIVSDCPNCDDAACTGCNGSQQGVVPPATNELSLCEGCTASIDADGNIVHGEGCKYAIATTDENNGEPSVVHQVNVQVQYCTPGGPAAGTSNIAVDCYGHDTNGAHLIKLSDLHSDVHYQYFGADGTSVPARERAFWVGYYISNPIDVTMSDSPISPSTSAGFNNRLPIFEKDTAELVYVPNDDTYRTDGAQFGAAYVHLYYQNKATVQPPSPEVINPSADMLKVTVKCDKTVDGHGEKQYALIAGTYSMGEYYESGKDILCDVTLKTTDESLQKYCEQYNQEIDPDHTLGTNNAQTLQLKYVWDNSLSGHWEAATEQDFVVNVKCEETAPDAPTEVDLDIKVDCVSDDINHTGDPMIVDLLEETYSIGEVVKNEETGAYTCQVTITNLQTYCDKYNETHPNHTLVADQTIAPVTLTYDKATATWTVPDTEITIQVQCAHLKITKSGGTAGEYYIMTVSGDGVNLKVAVPANGSVTVAGLEVGKTYTVTENANWSWRYNATSATSTLQAKVNEVTITNTQKNWKWLSGDSYEENWWGKFAANNETN